MGSSQEATYFLNERDRIDNSLKNTEQAIKYYNNDILVKHMLLKMI